MGSDTIRWRRAIEEESAELSELAASLARLTGSQAFDRLIGESATAIGAADGFGDAERLLEVFSRRLRRLWLDLACDAANRNYRSPPADQPVETATRQVDNFGYERELQPTDLEARCSAFFGPAPTGWRAGHLLFSSGQAAMAATLHLVATLLAARETRPLRIAHLGAYYETVQTLDLFPFLTRVGESDADAWLIEPIHFDGAFHSVGSSELRELRGEPVATIFDDTLSGAALDPAEDLVALRRVRPGIVARVTSGIKLLQGGLELANVGIVSLYTAEEAEGDAAGRLRTIRALFGLGLRFADLAALEAPWFLERSYVDRYRRAVFEHNAAFAQALAGRGDAFSLSHPALDCGRGEAPYCVLRLPGATTDRYERLARNIVDEAARRRVSLERGGSFGFRGHRFDVVTPEGEEPYLRFALGRRGGWSAEMAPEIVAQAVEMS